MSEWEQRTDLHGRIKRLYVEEDYVWCQESNARNQEGHACVWSDEAACEFCLLGAVYKVYSKTQHWYVVTAYLQTIFGPFWEGPMLTWNDDPDRTYEDVLAFLDKHKL